MEREVMGQYGGINKRYPPISRVEWYFLLGVPVAVFLFYKLKVASAAYMGPWIAIVVGCFVVGWFMLLAQRAIAAIERIGYRAGIEDAAGIAVAQYLEMIANSDPGAHEFRRKFDAHFEALLGSWPPK